MLRPLSKALIGLYAFAWKGKIRALELIRISTDARKTFIQLEKIGISPQNDLLDWKKFTCLVYATKLVTSQINDLR